MNEDINNNLHNEKLGKKTNNEVGAGEGLEEEGSYSTS
jgi:hypothetical protein